MPLPPQASAGSAASLTDLAARLEAAAGRSGAAESASVDRALLAEAAQAVAELASLAERFQERVAEARLAALRELAYGAGHEINNPLANIAARAQALLLDEREPERRRRLATIVDQAFRARDMIGGLMVFARPPRPEPEATSLEEVLQPLLASLQPQAAARRIALHCRPLPPAVPLRLDPGQVGEAVRLLIINAFEAVADGGHVEIGAAAQFATEAVEIEILDDGPGMDPETAARACDPFFSGREAGRGIGMGLPKALRLIEANGGRLEIAVRPGRGTRCGIWLPLAVPVG
jgi:signal transduction histidine kinase